MKQLLFVLLAAVSSLCVVAQKDFEGKIVYQLEASMDEKKPELTVSFAPGKLKLNFKEGEDDESEYVLVLMDSGKIFNINTSSKTYRVRLMNIKDPTPFTSEKKAIAGYPTTSVKNEVNSPTSALGGVITLQDMIMDVADNLTFTIPERLLGNTEFIMVHNNHIILGASMKMGTVFSAMGGDEKGEKRILARALSVTPMSFTADEFAIPKEYTLQEKFRYDNVDSAIVTEPVMYDSAVAMVDTVAVTYKAKKTAKKPAKKPASKKTIIKSAANRKQ